MKLTSLLAVPVLIVSSLSVTQAETIIQTTDFSNLSGSTSLIFDGFDSQLGELTSVTITLSDVFINGTATVTNNSAITRTYTVSLSGDFTIMDSSGNFVNLFVSSPAFSSGPVAPTNSYTTPTTTNLVAGADSATFFSGLAAYAATPTISLSLFGETQASVTGGGNFATGSSGLGSGTVTLSYDYTPVPEPFETSMLLLGFGACIMFGRSYLRRKQAAAV